MADPIQGLIDFVLAQKPYHTKILDLLVSYTHNDDVNVSISEDILFEIGLIFAAQLSDNSGDPSSLVETCPGGFGDGWDQQGQFLVVYGVAASDTIYLIGDATATFTTGVIFEVRDPDNIDPDIQYTVNTSTYNSVTNRTAVVVAENITGTEFFVVAAPPTNDDTVGNVFPIYTVESTSITGNMIVISGTGINIDDFMPGYSVTIRNATETLIDGEYRIAAAILTAPTEVTIFCLDNIAADTTLDGELVFSGVGYDEPSFCASSEDTIVHVGISERLDISMYGAPYQTLAIASVNGGTGAITLTGNLEQSIDGDDFPTLVGRTLYITYDTLTGLSTASHTILSSSFALGETTVMVAPFTDPGYLAQAGGNATVRTFQYFILEANSGTNTFVVEGDVRQLIDVADLVNVIHALDAPYAYPASITLNGNVGSHEVVSITYDRPSNRSTIVVDGTVVDSVRTGWIIPGVISAAPPSPLLGTITVTVGEG